MSIINGKKSANWPLIICILVINMWILNIKYNRNSILIIGPDIPLIRISRISLNNSYTSGRLPSIIWRNNLIRINSLLLRMWTNSAWTQPTWIIVCRILHIIYIVRILILNSCHWSIVLYSFSTHESLIVSLVLLRSSIVLKLLCRSLLKRVSLAVW